MAREDMLALALRVESLTGPDREVDARICIALGLSKDNVMVGVDGWCINSDTNPNPYRSPNYTTSLDAAMSLVPEGWGFVLASKGVDERYPDKWCVNMAQAPDNEGSLTFAATPVLALTAACLRARAEVQS